MINRKNDYINYRISKSHEVFEDAQLLAKNERWNSCVNRLYYSSYYLASALLYLSEIKAETHNGVKTQLFLNFVRNGKMNKGLAKLYSHLFDWRQESDYADFIEFDKKTVIPLLNEVKILNKELIKIIESERNEN